MRREEGKKGKRERSEREGRDGEKREGSRKIKSWGVKEETGAQVTVIRYILTGTLVSMTTSEILSNESNTD